MCELLPAGQAGGPGGQYSGTAGRIPEISEYGVQYVLRLWNQYLLQQKVSRYANTVLVLVFALPTNFCFTSDDKLYP